MPAGDSAGAPDDPGDGPDDGVLETGPLIDDFGIEDRLVARLSNGGAPPSLGREEIVGQIARTRCRARLPARCRKGTSPAALYAARRPCVVAIVGAPTKCEECPEWHLSSAAGGFLVSEDGLCVTNWHVVGESDTPLFVLDSADRIHGVREVVAASEADDIAVLRLHGKDFPAAPLGGDAPVGSRIYVISHPSGRYWSFTEGMVSRHSLESAYFRPPADKAAPLPPAGPDRPMMTITADFGAGSSGGPVFDAAGNVVGMVAETETFYAGEDAARDPQMVLKLCVPVSRIRALIEER